MKVIVARPTRRRGAGARGGDDARVSTSRIDQPLDCVDVVDVGRVLRCLARRGNAERLLAGLPHAIHDQILRIRGFGKKLELRPQRSPASEAALRRAVLVAADRGALGPSTEYLLLAVGEQWLPAQVLAELGITDVQALVDAKYPVTRPPIDPAIVQVRAAQLAAHGLTAPSPGPIPPIFERFTSQARDAVNAGIEHARKLDAAYVEPAHLLYGVLNARTGVVATVRARHSWNLPPAQIVQPSYSRATDIPAEQTPVRCQAATRRSALRTSVE